MEPFDEISPGVLGRRIGNNGDEWQLIELDSDEWQSMAVNSTI